MDGGNFGAVPNPPLAGSASDRSFATADDRACSSTGCSDSGPVCSAMCVTIRPAPSTSSSLRSVHARVTAVSTWTNEGSPCFETGG